MDGSLPRRSSFRHAYYGGIMDGRWILPDLFEHRAGKATMVIEVFYREAAVALSHRNKAWGGFAEIQTEGYDDPQTHDGTACCPGA